MRTVTTQKKAVDRLSIRLAKSMYLHVDTRDQSTGIPTIMIMAGKQWPHGVIVANFIARRTDIRLSASSFDHTPQLWVGAAAVSIPLEGLRKVAQVMDLAIPAEFEQQPEAPSLGGAA